MMLKRTVKTLLDRAGLQVSRTNDPEREFHSWAYLRHTSRRLEHLASLGIPVSGKTVLEVGAGIGDHTHYYLDRGCTVTVTEPRADNLAYLRQRYPNLEVLTLDLDARDLAFDRTFAVVHCYGLLYHLQNPAAAIRFMADRTTELLFLETCVSFGTGAEENLVGERQESPSQSVTGVGCRPTRHWVFTELRKYFEYVYCARTQPNHEEFVLDWTDPGAHKASLSRAVFVASRTPLANPTLVDSLPDHQVRHP